MLNKLSKFLIFISIILIISSIFYSSIIENQKEQKMLTYIKETSSISDEKLIINDNDTDLYVEEDTKEKSKTNYIAVLEIPSINLKHGLVNSDDNFDSINYAISIDANSTYPDQNGNFILYAHSGNSRIAYFNDLHKINLSDDLYVYYNGIKYHYKVFDKYNIDKTGKAYVINSNINKYITLITCNQQEKGKQIIIIGKLVKQLNY